MHTDLTLRHRLCLLAAAGLLALAGPALSQSGTGAPGAEQLRALIYYLEHNDQRSVQAEMRRLRASYPGWTPPTDLNQLRAQTQVGTTVETAPIWARIERGDHAGARALIDQTQGANPGWTPEPEMLRLVEMGEGQEAFDRAYAARDTAGVIAAARRAPAIMRCDRINNAWRLAEMYQAAGQRATAVETYRGVAGACAGRTDAVATLEKADEIATWPEMEQILAAARRAGPANGAALDALEARLRAGRGLGGSAPAASAQSATTTTASTAEPPIAAQSTAAQTGAASTSVPPASAAEGASRAASGTGMGASALAGLPLSGDGRLAAARRHKEAGRWAECATGSTRPRSVDLLYERSWCVYNLDRPGEALAGFTIAERNGRRLGANVTRDARFGMILSYLAMNMTEAGASLSATTDLTRQQRVEVETTILDQRGVRAYQGRDYAGAIRYFDALEGLAGTLRRDLAMMRGYAYLNTGQNELAETQFTRLHSQLATDETRTALRTVASRRGGG